MAGIADAPGFRFAGQIVPGELIGALGETGADADAAESLKRNGYLLLRGVIDADAVSAARNAVLERLSGVGEVAADYKAALPTGASRRAEMHADLGRFWVEVSTAPALRRVTHSPEVKALAGDIAGEDAVAFDFVWLRAMPPGRGSPLHVDHPYMNRGSDRLFTCWIPLGPVGLDESPLFVVEGSHRFSDVRAMFEGHDVDRDPSRPGHLDADPAEIARSRGARLLTTSFAAGDVLIFGMFTLHGSFDNASGPGRLRLSVDTRWQPSADPMDPRFAGPHPPAHGGRGYGCLGSSKPMTSQSSLR